MTPERAQYILANSIYGEFRFAFRRKCDCARRRIFADGITEAEDREIKAVWESMPGHTTYYDVVQQIAKGS